VNARSRPLESEAAPGAQPAKINADTNVSGTVGQLPEAALAYARTGRKVLPCWWRDFNNIEAKAPIGHLVPNGKDDATLNESLIRYWWKIKPKAMIGGVVPDNTVVLDLDPRHAEPGFDLHLWLTDTLGINPDDTLVCHSGNSDGGYHLYARAGEGRINPHKLPAGVDIREAGKNYCILPPSIHPATGDPYFWNVDGQTPSFDRNTDVLAPVWSWLTEPDPPRTYQANSNGTPNPTQLADILSKVADAVNGERNNLLYWGACRLTEDSYPRAAFNALHQAGIHTGLPGHEVTKTIRSANHALGGAL
jgi:Bifunctional DNA primase/polymerase, N-terminal